MIQPILFHEQDSIAVIAPHPDDECLGAASALLMAADRTDIYVLTDGSHGNPAKTVQEEAAIRKRQFEAEMEYVRPRSWHWLGVEDTKLASNLHALDDIWGRRLDEEITKLIPIPDSTGSYRDML